MSEDQYSFHLGDEPLDSSDETEFAVNEAAIYFDDNELVIAYGDGSIIGITIDSEAERKVVRTVLGDVNLWTAFLGGLSQAMEQVKGNSNSN